MKKALVAISSLMLTATFGSYSASFVNAYLSFSRVQNSSKVRWQDKHNPCGEPHKVFANQEPVVIDNPLCEYSVDLTEIPTVTHRELSEKPAKYDKKIVRVKGRFFSNFEDPFKSRFRSVMEQDAHDLPAIGAGYWSMDNSAELCNFIDIYGAETNSADVTLIIQFLDASGNPGAVTFNDGSPLLMTILAVEEMKSVPALSRTKGAVHRQHRNGTCWNSANHSFSIYD